MITITQAQALRKGDAVYHTTRFFDGSTKIIRYRVTSVKLWKRSPERVRLGLTQQIWYKGYITEASLLGDKDWYLPDDPELEAILQGLKSRQP